jgi:hypothetical protein
MGDTYSIEGGGRRRRKEEGRKEKGKKKVAMVVGAWSFVVPLSWVPSFTAPPFETARFDRLGGS